MRRIAFWFGLGMAATVTGMSFVACKTVSSKSGVLGDDTGTPDPTSAAMIAKIDASCGTGSCHGARRTGKIPFEMQNGTIPSSNPMTVIKDGEGSYIVKDGNGRLGTLLEVFGDKPDLLVEVNLLDIPNHYQGRQVRRLIKKVRETNDVP